MISMRNLMVLLLLATPMVSSAQSNLDYQRRGDHNEGIKSMPISSADIELLSATASYREPTKAMPDRLKLLFFHDGRGVPSIVVRELDNRHFYWLDKVTPQANWESGAFNRYAWDGSAVLKPLETSDSLHMYDLGVVVTLGTTGIDGDIRVAPVLFYHSHAPSAIGGYEFDFKTDRNARISASIYSASSSKKVYSQILPSVDANMPFSVIWNCGTAPNGSYRLIIKGYTLDTNDPIDMDVNFSHHGMVPK